jgi:3-deoxy-manno-octulosonate cytidylyltransferase (CMP-KDO synthetase)
MIQRVYEQCLKAKLNRVVVATDDNRIFEHVKDFRGEVVMTSNSHKSGTDRIAEAAKTLQLSENAIILNIQGDEPFIDPKDINTLAACFNDERTQIATLVKAIKEVEILLSSNSPKVVLGLKNQALYFSREAIPHLRGVEKKDWLTKQTYFQHIGIYAFKHATLNALSLLPMGVIEQAEGLEQLRWLENGYTIKTAQINSECIAVDCPEDLKRIDEKFFS